MTDNYQIIIQDIESLLVQRSDSAYAAKMAAYMKGNFKFHGVRGPDRKDLLKQVKIAVKNLDIEQLVELSVLCWGREEREFQYVMIDLLKWKKSQLLPVHLSLMEQLIITKSWWDSVDLIAANLVGEILRNDKNLQYASAERWMASDHLWLKRTAIIHQLRYGAEADYELLFALIESQKSSKEFFINKACGWALRQYSKYAPSAVREFLTLHPDLPNLTIREGSKYL